MGWRESDEGVDIFDIKSMRAPTDVEVVFPAKIGEWLPSMKCLGEDPYRYMNDRKWGALVSSIFFSGGTLPEKLKEGYDEEDKKKLYRIIKACLGTFACSHEQKTAGVAYIMEKHFEWTDAEEAQVTR